MYAAMCLSFPAEAAESHRFSCNTLVNSPCMSGYCHQSSCVSLSSILAYSLICSDGFIILYYNQCPTHQHTQMQRYRYCTCVRVTGMCNFVFDMCMQAQLSFFFFPHCILFVHFLAFSCLSLIEDANDSTKTRQSFNSPQYLSFQSCVHYVYKN